MLKNYIITALRNLSRNRLFTLINILGLAIGLACFTLIVLYVKNELSYDRHHPHADNIYRLILTGTLGGNDFNAAVTGGVLGELVQEEVPEVINHTTVYRSARSILFRYGEQSFYQDRVFYADSGFFKIFSYEFLAGDPATALDHPNSVVLTDVLARKIFGNENPVGRVLEWNNTDQMVVRGVVKTGSHRSHLQFDALASLNTFRNNQRMWPFVNSLWTFTTHNYVQTAEGVSAETLRSKMLPVKESHMREAMDEYGMNLDIVPQPITRIHLHSHLVHELDDNGDISRIYIFSAIALLILLVACINFVNLSTAKSTRRAREMGVRKVFGAHRSMLFRQLMSESVIWALISMVLALMFVEIFLPLFNNLAGISFGKSWLADWKFLLMLLGVTLAAGVVSGIYPALVLSSYSPIRVLRSSTFKGTTSRSWFRNIMVVIQFAISIFLIFSTIVIDRQLRYIENKDLGINEQDILVAPIRDRSMMRDYDQLKGELMNIPGVTGVTASSTYLGNYEHRRGYYTEGETRKNITMYRNIQVDYNYLDMFQTRIVEGRNFSDNRKFDSTAIIINQAMARKMGWDQPLGKRIYMPDDDPEVGDVQFRVIGVVKDFNYASLHLPVEPLLINVDENFFRYLNIRIDHQAIAATLPLLEEKWNERSPRHPFDYFFIDTRFQNFYAAETKMSSLFSYFSVLALLIAAMGLFGLALYATEQRTREIGIRKVFGGSVGRILRMLLREFLQWVLIANLIAWPLAWFFMHNWLGNFAYRSTITWWVFLLSAAASLVIAVITVSWQSIRTARQNPVKSLRYE